MISEVVYCSDCKKPIKSVPAWLANVNVRFSCESCRQRHPRGAVGMDTPAPAPRIVSDPDIEGEELVSEPGEQVVDDDAALEEVDGDTDEALVGSAVEE